MNDRSAEHHVTAIPARELRRARLLFLLVGVGIPFVLSAVSCALILAWIPELPSPAATHWSFGGVDGFGSPMTYAWTAAIIGFVLPALIALLTLLSVRDHWGGAARLVGGLALGLSGFGAVVNVGSVGVQRGLTDAKEVGPVGGIVLCGLLAFAALMLLGWVVQPHVRPAPAAPLRAAHVASISQGERVVWMATATMSRVAVLIVAAVVVLVVGVTAVMAFQAAEKAWIPILTLVLIGGAFASSASFRVRIGPDGLSVRSQVGFPRVHVPLDEIESVRAVECNPFGEFGGFGWRLGLDGRTGIVLRRGPAIEVERRDKRPLVVTVDGAQVGAAVLQAYLDQRALPSDRSGGAGS